MTNEILQWAALAALGILSLGLLRQIALTVPPEARAIAVNGPAIGKRLPDGLVTELDQILPTWRLEDSSMLAFVTESCAGCRQLLASLGSRQEQALAEPLVLVAKTPSPVFRGALAKVDAPAILDSGELWNACQVTATPLIIRIDSEGRVLAKGVTHRVDEDTIATQ